MMKLPLIITLLLVPLVAAKDDLRKRRLQKPKPPMVTGNGFTESLSSETPTCHDLLHDWHDSDGKYYNCDWYNQNDYCTVYGAAYKNRGETAKTNCCACGGGTMCTNDAGWRDSESLPCSWYEEDDSRCCMYGDLFGNNGKTARTACCVCGGGNRDDGECVDIVTKDMPDIGWHDSDGPRYTCAWYAEGTRCDQYGAGYAKYGYTANQACCVCGGGE